MDLKEKYGLSKSTYEIAEIGNLYTTKNSANLNIPHDYGTGEMYTSVEAHTITEIYFRPGVSAKEIADKTARTQSAVSQIVSKLVSKGLIETKKSPDDSRVNCLYLTEKGQKLALAHIEYDENLLADALDEVISMYGVDAMENFIKIFSYFANNEEW